MVFYRKYRPQIIGELDSQRVRESLFSLLSKNFQPDKATFQDIPHAFLFTGPKGLGKTSTARIVAKVVNCVGRDSSKKTKDPNIEPCNNNCEQCISITNGTNMDVQEIDAASNRGIDEIRDLKDKIRLSPLSAKKKVYIIDEVHMLTTEAFNALLKTLEEPPSHAMFVLCTTEPHKVPSTILSRCSHVLFEVATTEELIRSFKRIVLGEKIQIDDTVLQEIAYLSEGGFRDGAKILEELSSYANDGIITRELIEERYKVTSIAFFSSEMLQIFEKRDTKAGLLLIEKAVKQGIDMRYLLGQLITKLHDAMLMRIGVTQNKKTPIIVSKLTLDEIRMLVDLLSRAAQEIKYAVLPQIPLELAMMDFGYIENTSEQVVTETQTTQSTVDDRGSITVTSMRKTVGNMAKIKALYGDSTVKEIKDKPSDNIVTSKVNLLQYSAESDTKEWVDALWKSIISEMKMHNHTIAGVLRGCRINRYDRKSLIIETDYKFHKERLDEIKTKQMLDSVLKELTGNPVAVSIVLKKQ